MDTIKSPKQHIPCPRAKKRREPKSVAILNAYKHTPSPHVLDLKQISLPQHNVHYPNKWHPNKLHQFLSHPIKTTNTKHPGALQFHTVPTFKTKLDSRRVVFHIRAFIQQLISDTAKGLHAIGRAMHLPMRYIASASHAIGRAMHSSAKHVCQSASCFANMNTRSIRAVSLLISKTKHPLHSVNLKTSAAFAVTALILILPLKALSAYAALRDTRAKLQNESINVFQSLTDSGNLMSGVGADEMLTHMQNALALFKTINNELDEIGPVSRTLIRFAPARFAQFETGKKIMRAGELISQALIPLTNELAQSKAAPTDGPAQQINTLKQILQDALPLITSANKELQDVKPDAIPLSVQIRDKFQTIAAYLADLESDIQNGLPLLDVLYEFAGGARDKRYLIILQNNTEMRATGGFIGSFALLDVSRGRIKQIRFPNGGSYDLQGYLKTDLEPPAPLKILRTRWEFQDANWFPDFPASARKLAWFYEKSGGATVDGVIALDTNVLTDLLKFTGPLTIPSFNKTISAENALSTIQTEVEINYDRSINKPKQFLGAVIEETMRTLTNNPINTLLLFSLVERNLTERHIQLMSFDDSIQQTILNHGWGGAIKDVDEGDYLAIINTNIGGQKTDGVIAQRARLQTSIQTGGSIINTLTIERKHQGRAGELFYGAPNIDYVRILVPKGSTLIGATGFSYPEENMVKISDKQLAADADLTRLEANQQIDEASGTVINTQFEKTTFANWIITKPGETSIATITYRLPFGAFTTNNSSLLNNLNALFGNTENNLIKYSLLTQKQAGMSNNNLVHRLVFPGSTEAVWSTPNIWRAISDRSYEMEINSYADIFNGFLGRIKK